MMQNWPDLGCKWIPVTMVCVSQRRLQETWPGPGAEGGHPADSFLLIPLSCFLQKWGRRQWISHTTLGTLGRLHHSIAPGQNTGKAEHSTKEKVLGDRNAGPSPVQVQKNCTFPETGQGHPPKEAADPAWQAAYKEDTQSIAEQHTGHSRSLVPLSILQAPQKGSASSLHPGTLGQYEAGWSVKHV